MDLRLAETQCRFAPPPWTTDSPAWQSLHRQLAADHRSRWIDAFVNDLDLSEFEALYRGSGSQAYRPDLMLKIALLETLEGHLSPAAWARHRDEHIPLQWLSMGIRPSRTAWYNFRDRFGHAVEALLADVVDIGQREGCQSFEITSVRMPIRSVVSSSMV